MMVSWALVGSSAIMLLLSGCLSTPAETAVPLTSDVPVAMTAVPRSTLGPLPDKLYIELDFIGAVENAHIKFWISGEKQKTHIVRTGKKNNKIIEAGTIFDKPFMYIIDADSNSCTKLSWNLPEGDPLSGFIKSLDTIYNPYVADKLAAAAYWDARCRDDTGCSNISVSEGRYKGEDTYNIECQKRREQQNYLLLG